MPYIPTAGMEGPGGNSLPFLDSGMFHHTTVRTGYIDPCTPRENSDAILKPQVKEAWAWQKRGALCSGLCKEGGVETPVTT